MLGVVYRRDTSQKQLSNFGLDMWRFCWPTMAFVWLRLSKNGLHLFLHDNNPIPSSQAVTRARPHCAGRSDPALTRAKSLGDLVISDAIPL
jgi:hypothetical protein